MNKYFYRIIFNKVRGILMVVAEIAKSNQGTKQSSKKTKSITSKQKIIATLKPVAFMTYIALGLVSLSTASYANTIIVDQNADKSQRPTTQQVGNGVTQINIQQASKGGVSHNKYTQFDVSEKGVILNNSSQLSNTQLAGYIKGNDNLIRSGSAKVILNEVNAKDASKIAGYIEVAGQKAQVIIANPAGITCNGCGFINADRATLTTGKPIIENGQLKGYQVEQGNITINGKGLDSSQQNYTDLIARSVNINASLWANDATVVTGKNKVSADLKQIDKLADDGAPKPQLAVDVSALGGMYAGKIQMVGTESGVGVHNSGHLGASAGGITITADGKIVNTGVIDSQGDLQVKSNQDIDNKGKLISQRNLALQSNKTVNQQGHVIAGNDVSINANKLIQSNQGITAAGTTVAGERLSQGNLTITTEQDVALQGQVQAGGKAHIKGQSIDANTVNLNSQSLALEASDGDVNVNHARIQVDNDATFTAKQTVDTQKAIISTGELNINGQTLNNGEGVLAGKTAINVNTDALINQLGQLLSQGKLTLSGQTGATINSLDNTQGKITSLGSMQIASNTLTGDGQIESAQDMLLTILSHWLNQQTIHANGNMTINAQGGTDNVAAISAGGQLNLNTQALHNQQTGDIQGKTTTIKATNLLNHGVIDGDLTDIHATELKNEDSGRIYGDKVVINATNLINQKTSASTVAPVIAGRENVFIGATNVLNKDHALLLSGGDLAIGAQATETGVTGYSGQINNHSASIEATGNITLSTNTFDNRDLHLKLSDTPIVVDRKSFHEFEWCSGNGDGGCFGGNGKRYLVQDRNGNSARQIIDENGVPTGEGAIGYETRKRARFNVIGLGYTKHFIEYYYDKVTYETQIENQDPAKIQAGKNLVINAQIATNQDSQLLAGKSLAINAVQFNNLETKGERWVKEQDSIGHENQGRISHYKGGGDDWRTKQSYSSYQGNNTTEAISLGTLKVAENTDTPPTTAIDEKQGVSTLPPTLSQYPVVVPVTLPNNSLYQIRPGKESNYLIETDPRFTNRKKWVSSLDFYDSSSVQKRLGDGYYEQSLIRDQLLAATGNQYLTGYEESNEQYRDLLVAGNLYAKTYQITPGIALTAEQMAALTTNMVWMVNQAITLPNGEVEIVSVPKLYLAADQTGLTQQGSLVHAGQVTINTQDDLNNQGVISGDSVNVNSHNINNSGTIQGDTVALTADQDIVNTGGRLQAKKELDAQAGRDFIMTTEQHQEGKERWLDSVSTVYVSDSEGKLHLSGQRDIVLTAANIIGLGNETTLNAGRDIKLDTQTTSHATDYTRDSKRYDRREWSEDVGTSITTVGDLSMKAGRDVTVKAGDISSQGDVNINAGNDISITTGDASFDHSASSTWSKKSLFSKTKTTLRGEEHNETAISSSISGENVTLNSGNDLNIKGSQVTGTKDVALAAGGDVNIDAAEESYYSKTQTIIKKSGLMSSGGLGVTIGKERTDIKQTDTQQGYQASTVGSTEGNVTITSGKDVSVKGSDMIAKKDVNITGENVTIAANDSETKYKEEYKYEKSGLTIAITGTPADVYDAKKAVDNAKKKDNDTILALQSIKSGLTTANAGLDVYGAANGATSSSQASIGVSASFGSEKTKRVTNEEQHTVMGSGVSAGDNINITATGNEQKTDGNINVTGSEVRAGNDITLNANQDINVIGAVNTQHRDMDEKSSSSSMGVGVSVGTGGPGWSVSGNKSFTHEREKQNGSAWSEGIIDAGNNLTIKTGNDANIIGGQVKGDTVKADIGNNLNIQSLQDSDNYDYKKLSTSVGGSYNGSFTPGGVGGPQFSGSSSKTTMDSNWASVTDQSGIYAGKGGFDITVGNNTDLKGAVIASSADDKTKNTLDTGTISFEDIKNKADYKVDSTTVNIGLGKDNKTGYTPSASPPSVYHNDGSDSSITKSAVEGGTLIVRDTDKQQQDVNELSRDTENANDPLGQIFNKQKEQDRIDELNLVKDIAAQAKDVANKYSSINAELKYNASSEEEKNKLKKEAEQALKNQGIKDPSEAAIRDQAINSIVQKEGTGNMGDSFSKGVDAASSIISGIISGDITGGLAGASAPYLAEQIKKYTGHYDEAKKDWVTDDKAANLIAHAILGGAVAAAQGNSALAGAGGAISGESAVEYIKDFLYGEKTKISDLTQAQKENLSNLAQIASGLAIAGMGGSTSDVGAAVSASKNAVENNRLSQVVTGSIAQQTQQSTIAMLGFEQQTKSANEQMALALEQTLKAIADFPVDFYNNLSAVEQEKYIHDLVNEMTPQQMEALKQETKITFERNQIAMGNRPKVENINDYMRDTQFGQILDRGLELQGYDVSGNPIYQAANGGAGNYIWTNDMVTFDSNRDVILVYSQNGQFLSALNLDGSKNDTLTDIYKGGTLSTIVNHANNSNDKDKQPENQLVSGGSVAVSGAPGLPPDDDNNNDDKKDQEKDSSKGNRDPKDRIQHEDYKDDLRAKMEKPDVKDSELKNIMDDLYRPNAKIGSGSTADAVRYEAATGQNVGGKLHLEKAKNYVKALESWLKRNPTASSADRAAAENVLRDLQNALRGK